MSCSECDSSSESEDTKHARCEDISSEHSTDDDWSEPEEVCENKGAVTSVHGEEHVVREEEEEEEDSDGVEEEEEDSVEEEDEDDQLGVTKPAPEPPEDVLLTPEEVIALSVKAAARWKEGLSSSERALYDLLAKVRSHGVFEVMENMKLPLVQKPFMELVPLSNKAPLTFISAPPFKAQKTRASEVTDDEDRAKKKTRWGPRHPPKTRWGPRHPLPCPAPHAVPDAAYVRV